MTRADFLPKQTEIAGTLCCPSCKTSVRYTNMVHLKKAPIFAGIDCPDCGDVGTVSLGRFIFTGSEDVNQPKKGFALKGNWERKVGEPSNLPLGNHGWNVDGARLWMDQADHDLTVKTDALGIALSFLKHPWSGLVEIHVNGKLETEIDLFEAAGSMILWHPIYLGKGQHSVTIKPKGQKNEASHGTQVWFCELEKFQPSESQDVSLFHLTGNNGNPYPDIFHDLVKDVPSDGLILDCGCGDRNYDDTRVVSFEYSKFALPDVFGDGHKLPFKDNTFDLILSQAVIEHLYDPYLGAAEIQRVLKPGGTVYAESAFMQPLHAVPFHFFNTTGWGLERLFADMTDIKVEHHGDLKDTLEWIYSITSLPQKGFSDDIQDILKRVEALDEHISEDELRYFASYVSLIGKKRAAT